MKIPRIVIAGTKSGVGKTSITLGIIFVMIKKGYSVQPFKVGPDYIDPSYLSAISNTNARNLDMWLMGKTDILKSFVRNSSSNISVIEGVMGFYDGAYGSSNFANTYQISNILNAPVILILDASKTARSIAATAFGYKKFQQHSNIVGFILNKLHSKKHESMCKQALRCLNLPVLGSIYKDENLVINSRYLGLVPATEKSISISNIKKISNKISDSLNMAKIIDVAYNSKNLSMKNKDKKDKKKVKIAIALDQAFNFYYYDNLDLLKKSGAVLQYFSPMHDDTPPDCDGIYIGGGFPEVFGNILEQNTQMKNCIKKMAEDETPIYAECGGLMYLSNSISNKNKVYPMTRLLDCEIHMTNKLKLNYTKGIINASSILSNKNMKAKGHEFHYSKVDYVRNDSKFAYKLSLGDGIKNKQDCLICYKTLASYMHIYFNKKHMKNLIRECTQHMKK